MSLAAGSAWAVPPEISVETTPLGQHLRNAQGFSLYFYDRDTAGKSVCIDACSQAWPPLLASSDAVADGDWTLITRDHGLRQWAYKGRPLYAFGRDPAPKATMGDGLQTVWHLAIDRAPRPETIKFQATLSGYVAADATGKTLYARDSDSISRRQKCVEACLAYWQPTLAPAIAGPVGDWAPVLRDDGITQWAYKGKLLYTFSGDVQPGDMLGEGAEKGWHALVLEPSPGRPPWLKIQASDYGPILADEQGMTLYSIAKLDRVTESLCLEACLKTFWRPVIAPPEARPVGNWSIVKSENGISQWAFRNKLIFTHTRDTKPGDILGDRFADGIGDFGWDVIPASALVEKSL